MPIQPLRQAQDKQKILIATPLFPPDIGGPATYSAILLEELPRHDLIVEVVSFGQVRKLPKIIRHIAYGWLLIRKIKGIDIIYAQDPVSVGLPAMMVAKIFRRRFWLKVVGDYAWEQGRQRFGVKGELDDFVVERKTARWPVKVLFWLEKLVASQAERIIVPSQYLAGIVENWGIKNKIEVIYNAIAWPPADLDRMELRRELGWSGKIIFSAGRLVPWKGFVELIEVMPSVFEKNTDAKLYIAGDGPDYQQLEKLIAKLGLAEKVFLLGRVEQRRLWEMIKASDLFFLNTRYEGLSHILIETLALGTPVIATAVGGNPEVIEDGINGYLIQPGDQDELNTKIVQLLNDYNLAQRLAVSGSQVREKFSRANMIAGFIKLLS